MLPLPTHLMQRKGTGNVGVLSSGGLLRSKQDATCLVPEKDPELAAAPAAASAAPAAAAAAESRIQNPESRF